jgi:hypothetical protein
MLKLFRIERLFQLKSILNHTRKDSIASSVNERTSTGYADWTERNAEVDDNSSSLWDRIEHGDRAR